MQYNFDQPVDRRSSDSAPPEVSNSAEAVGGKSLNKLGHGVPRVHLDEPWTIVQTADLTPMVGDPPAQRLVLEGISMDHRLIATEGL